MAAPELIWHIHVLVLERHRTLAEAAVSGKLTAFFCLLLPNGREHAHIPARNWAPGRSRGLLFTFQDGLLLSEIHRMGHGHPFGQGALMEHFWASEAVLNLPLRFLMFARAVYLGHREPVELGFPGCAADLELTQILLEVESSEWLCNLISCLRKHLWVATENILFTGLGVFCWFNTRFKTSTTNSWTLSIGKVDVRNSRHLDLHVGVCVQLWRILDAFTIWRLNLYEVVISGFYAGILSFLLFLLRFFYIEISVRVCRCAVCIYYADFHVLRLLITTGEETLWTFYESHVLKWYLALCVQVATRGILAQSLLLFETRLIQARHFEFLEIGNWTMRLIL